LFSFLRVMGLFFLRARSVPRIGYWRLGTRYWWRISDYLIADTEYPVTKIRCIMPGRGRFRRRYHKMGYCGTLRSVRFSGFASKRVSHAHELFAEPAENRTRRQQQVLIAPGESFPGAAPYRQSLQKSPVTLVFLIFHANNLML